MIITKITAQKKSVERFNIFLDKGDGEQFGFSIDQDVLISFQLKKGKELNEELLGKILSADQIKKAYQLALHYLSYRMRTEKEVRDYLLKKEILQEAVEQVIKKLYEYKYINDEEYALSYVRTKMATSIKGPIVIGQELQQKGVDISLNKRALEQYSIDMQIEKAAAYLTKKQSKSKRESLTMWRKKQTANLISRGFGSNVIQEAFLAISEEINEDDQLEAITYQVEKLQKKHQSLTEFERKWKIKQALFQKGFSQDLIERLDL